MTDWFKAKLGGMRVSTIVLIIVFLALFWVQQTFHTETKPPAPVPASNVVPPGFVPDPAYTWVPRTSLQERPTTTEPTTTTPTTTTPTTTTTSPTETTSPTSPTSTSPGPTTATPLPAPVNPGPGPSPTPPPPAR
jgi:cytoskeletal protein RodZ